jgi:hypothetical protein
MNCCDGCGAIVEEVCPDLYCRECHVSVSFEDCCDSTYNAKAMIEAGLRTVEQARKEWPRARI